METPKDKPNLTEKVKTYFTGTKEEIKEKVGDNLAFAIYIPEMFCTLKFGLDIVDGKFDACLAPFAADFCTRLVHSYRDIYRWSKDSSYELGPHKSPGIIGTIKSLKKQSHEGGK